MMLRSLLQLLGLLACVAIAWGSNYQNLGCFKDRPNRAISGGYENFNGDPVRSCYLKAKRLGNRYFAVQFNTQCFTSRDAGQTYARYGPIGGCRGDGRGGWWRQNVYKIIGHVGPNVYIVPKLSVVSAGSRTSMKCEFTPTNEASRVYEVTWFYSVDGRDVQLEKKMLNNKQHTTFLQNTDVLRTFHMGYTMFVRLRTWLPSEGMTSATVRTSNRYYMGIKLSPMTLSISESGSPVSLKVTPTVPILCEDRSTNCSISVRLVQSHPDILISSCTLVFKASTTIPTSQTVTVTAKRGFVDYGSVKVVITAVAKYHPSPSSTGDWYKPTSPSTVQVTTGSVSAGQCTSSGDPHLRTFDNTFFNHYYVGDYTLVKSTARRFEVHVRTHRCARVSCNCGVAVREGDDVLVVDMCRNRFSPQPRYASNQEPARGTYIERSANGKTFILKFASGTVVKFVARHWFGSNYYADVTVQVPPDDFKHTQGLCGVFDKNKGNDMTARDGRVWQNCRGHACPGFTESWKLSSSESLFYFTPTTKGLTCQPRLQTSHCMCGKNTTVCDIPVAPPLLKRTTRGFTKLVFAGQAECEKLREKPIPGVTKPGVTGPVQPIKPCITLPTCKSCIYPYVPPTTKPYVPTWPTEDGLDETDAQKICDLGIKQTRLFNVCKKYVDAAMIAGFMDQCVADIQILDSKGIQAAIRSATDALKEACEDHATKNPNNWKNENGTVVPPTDVIDVACPNQCSNKGVCTKGSCVCNEGYLTEDCSVKEGQKPTLTTIKDGALCKTDNDTDCRSVVFISEGLIPGNIQCYFSRPRQPTIKTAAILISFSEVRCDLPAGKCGDAGFADVLYDVRLGNGDAISTHFSPFRMINSKCMSCDGGTCVQKTGVCVVNGCCYGAEEADPKDNCSYCNAEKNNTEFSRRNSAGCKVHPCDLNNGGCADKCKKIGKNATCVCTVPETELGNDGRSCKKIHPCDLNNGGCADKCKKIGENATCVCTVPETELGNDGKSCKKIHPCDLNNGGCADKCVRVGENATCVCTVSGTELGKDGRTCEKVHPCDLSNGGCGDRCEKVGEKALCVCTALETYLGTDRRSCVQGCRKIRCRMFCKQGFETDANGCAICKCKSNGIGSTNKIDIHLTITQSHYPVARNAPRLLVQLSMNPGVEGSSMVPENCYATSTMDRFDPYRIYFLRNRFPVLNSYMQHSLTKRFFKFSVSPSAILKYHKGPTYVHCNCRVCPPGNPRCYFAARADANDAQPRYHDAFREQLVHSMAVVELY